MVDAIVAAGMEPVVTLMHFVWPQHVEERGGLRAPQFPEWFGAYAARVRDAIGDRVRYWITHQRAERAAFWLPQAVLARSVRLAARAPAWR